MTRPVDSYNTCSNCQRQRVCNNEARLTRLVTNVLSGEVHQDWERPKMPIVPNARSGLYFRNSPRPQKAYVSVEQTGFKTATDDSTDLEETSLRRSNRRIVSSLHSCDFSRVKTLAALIPRILRPVHPHLPSPPISPGDFKLSSGLHKRSSPVEMPFWTFGMNNMMQRRHLRISQSPRAIRSVY